MKERYKDELVGQNELEERIAQLERANAELRTRGEKYRSLVNNLDIGILRSLPQGGQPILEANLALARMFGYDDVAEIQAIEPATLYADPRDRVAIMAEILEHGGVKDRRARMRRRDGTVITCSLTVTLVRDQNGEVQFVDGAIEDITDQVRTEAELRDSEAKYRQLVDNALEGIWAVDREWRTSFVNQSMAEMLGYSPEEMVGRPLTSFMDVESRSRVNDLIARRESGMGEVHDFEFLRKDGSKVYTSLSASAFLDDRGRFSGGVAMVRDITARREAEEALRQSEERFRSLAEQAPVGVFETDPQGLGKYVNRKWLEMTGLTAEQALGDGWREALHPEDREKVFSMWKEHARDKAPWCQEYRFMSPDGRVTWILGTAVALRNERGRVLGYIGIDADITERKRYTDELHRSEQRFRSLIENAPVAIGISRDGLTTYVNPRYLKMFGYQGSDELLERPITEQIAPQDRERASEFFRPQAEGRRDREEMELLGLCKDGSAFPFHAAVTEVHLPDGPATLGFFTDITERKRAEKALLEKTEELDRYFTNSMDLLCIADSDGFFRRLNPEWERALDYPTTELEGRNFLDLVHPDDVPATLEAMDRLQHKNAVLDFINRYRRKDGTYRWLEWRSFPVGKAIYSVARDVTERKRVEEALQNSQQMLQLVLDNIPQRVIWKDLDLNYLGSNQNAARDAGLADPKDIVGKNDHELAWREFADLYQADDRRIMESGEPKLNFEEKLQRLDGTERWVKTSKVPLRDQEGKVFGVLGTYEDITERKRVEEALRLSEERFRLILSNSPVNVSSQDLDLHYTWIYNPQLGYSPSDVVGKTDSDLLPPETAEQVIKLKERAIFTKAIVRDTVWAIANGQTFYYDFTVEPLLDPDGNVVGVNNVVVDITERKRVEEALQNSEERFRILSEATFEGIVVHADGVILDVNQAALEQTGYTREEAIGRSILDLFTPESQAVIREVIQKQMVEAYEAHLIKKGGELRTVRIKARTIQFHGQMARVATIMDITEQVEARCRIEELVARKEEERQRLRTILDTLPVSVVIIDRSGQVVENNSRAHEIWGVYTQLEPKSIQEYKALTGWWADTGVPLNAEDWTVARAIKENRTIIGDIIDVQRLDGGRGTIMSSAAPLLDQGKVIGGVVVTEDITKQRELEHEAIAAKERAELYIDLLTHDINNMNAAAKGYLQLVESKSDLDSSNMQRLIKCEGALDDISELIEKVKKIQMIEGPDARRDLVDLGWTIEDVVQSFKDLPGKEARINYRPQLKRMVLASELLSDVFTNLIGNAIKHSDGTVTVDINIGKKFEEGREYYKVSVEDDGPGIPDEAKKRIFSRLQRGKTRASGSGLGLYLVRSLVEDYQGRVWVEDRVHGDHTKGARFVVTLPVVAMPENARR